MQERLHRTSMRSRLIGILAVFVLSTGLLATAWAASASPQPAPKASSTQLLVSKVVKSAEARTEAARPAIPKDAQTWYVSASAPAGGNGTQAAPFNSLQQAQAWSAPGDIIEVLPSPASTPPLDGGITLQPGQTLIGAGPSVTTLGATSDAPRITNSTGFGNDGNGIVLANYSTVKNIMVVKTYRVGIYGPNVTGANILDNNVSGQNTSCDVGIWIFPFWTYTSTGIPNGWAGIMLDNNSGSAFDEISGNYVDDATCGDGVDVRLAGTAAASALITDNTINNLQQGTAQGLHSVLAVGIQTADLSALTAEVNGNTETNIGSPGADSEGVFANVGGSSTANVDIDNDVANNITGGASANGLEVPLMQGAAHANVSVENSSFTNVQGDILEGFTFGINQRLAMTFNHVTASKASLASGADTFTLGQDSAFYNRASCLLLENMSPEFLNGGNNSLAVSVSNSTMTQCAVGVADTIWRSTLASSLNIYNSTITDNRVANLYVKNADPVTAAEVTANPALVSPTNGLLGSLYVKVRDSNLSGATNGPDLYAYADPGTVGSLTIDLGTPQDPGQNNLAGGLLPSVQLSGVPVSAEWNWWGQTSGPSPSTVALSNGATISDKKVLTSPPS